MPPEALRSLRRSRRARHVLLATVAACSALLVVPGAVPHGQVLDLVSQAGPGIANVSGGESTTNARPTPPPAAPSPTPDPGTRGGGASDVDDVPPRGAAQLGAFTPTAPPIETLEDYVWPIAHPRLTLPFGPTPWGSRMVDGQPFHDGVDLATFCGDRVTAAHAGTVLAAGRRFDAFIGWIGDLEPYTARLDSKHLWSTLPIVVVIDDGNGYRSIYAHFGRIIVSPGQVVRAGQLLGYEGMTGRASGCHLHYGLFSPWERAVFGVMPDVAQRMRFPPWMIARVDPLLVLPPKPGLNAPASPRSSPAPSPSRAP